MYCAGTVGRKGSSSEAIEGVAGGSVEEAGSCLPGKPSSLAVSLRPAGFTGMKVESFESWGEDAESFTAMYVWELLDRLCELEKTGSVSVPFKAAIKARTSL